MGFCFLSVLLFLQFMFLIKVRLCFYNESKITIMSPITLRKIEFSFFEVKEFRKSLFANRFNLKFLNSKSYKIFGPINPEDPNLIEFKSRLPIGVSSI